MGQAVKRILAWFGRRNEIDRSDPKYGLGDWWCPDCGQWIVPGDGKFTNDNFIVHEWCS